MKRSSFIFLFLAFFSVSSSYTQIAINSFRLLENDLTAITNGTQEIDQNGEVAALIKVVTTQKGFTFDNGMIGITKVVPHPGEYWVYVPKKTQKINIYHENLGVLRDYFFPTSIESGRTYEMVLTTGTVVTTVQKALISQYVVLKIQPKNATLLIDNEEKPLNEDGVFSARLSLGEHSYRVTAASYQSEEGSITVSSEKLSQEITLVSARATLIVKTSNDAFIYVNDELKGTGNWTGEVDAGIYLVEVRKEGHRSVIEEVTLVQKEKRTLTLAAPSPIFGSLDVNSDPLECDIYIDGVKRGITPEVIEKVLIGKHEILLKKEGFAEMTDTVFVKENETTTIKLKMDDSAKTRAEALYKKGLELYDNEKYEEAVPLLRRAAELGNAEAQRDLGVAYYYGIRVKQSYVESIKWLYKSASQGESLAQIYLGDCYRKGTGVRKNISEAINWYKKAAEQENMYAIVSLGDCYFCEGITQNLEEAFIWYKKAAEQGFTTAQNNLGVLYEKGNGVEQDYYEAVKWYKKAAEQGLADAQINLGVLYEKGNGVEQDYYEAVKWYKKAAEQGFADAQCNLGVCYLTGDGVKEDFSEAVKWFRKAAEQGIDSAQYNLGICLEKGAGISRNIIEAKKWYQKAAEQGHEKAIEALERLKY